jgi:hypothetical protein
MRLRSALGLVFLVLAAIFVFLNWPLFAAQERLNLLVASVQAPVGVLVLTLLALCLGVAAVYAGTWHGTLLAQLRRQGAELETQRGLAQSAEASRLTELGTLIKSEIGAAEARLAAQVGALRQDLEHTENAISATLAEMDDRMRTEQAASPRRPII